MIEVIIMKSDNKIVQIIKNGQANEYAGQQHKVKKIPDQDVSQFYDDNGLLKEIYYPDDISCPLDFVKQKELEKIRSKANQIITAKWPLWKQQNCNAGIYPQSTKDQKDQDIANVIEASNSAEDKVDNASTIDEVEAVEPIWPTI